ncbi:hypothetical protein BJ138DRAFT_1121870 [Hygrophoropsis aurantiaca]|uniref:Uncharacterized protein n=1 Tax=Hygrophoropsis aurantiaca TaxID=72124 RepID=A0ACB8AT16_9AGAM|nr:hypothetical protein BJ138DRAFT_1121870 [Hygrophoropsis aurantiaca]
MWCTRWFLPLLLLPLPIAPPYFLVLFLFSLALHAKPCFYCVVLLGALFLSSCYWQSFPLDTALSVPWSSNITTFSEALNASLATDSDLFQVKPSIIRVVDRCWCDFASGMFEPFDVRTWEEASVQRLKMEIEKQIQRHDQLDSDQDRNGNLADLADENPSADSQDPPKEASLPTDTATPDTRSPFSVLRSLFRQNEPNVDSTDLSQPPPTTPLSEQPTSTKTSDSQSEFTPEPASERSLAPGEFDLRPYGFDLIFDLRWSRNS